MGQSSSSSSSCSSNDVPENWSHFNVTGPLLFDHTAIDWAHQRVVTSTLINALYVSQDDFQAGRHATEHRAPRWWSFSGFELAERLMDTNDRSTTNSGFGAVFRRRTASTSGPAIVFALRGVQTARDWNVTIKAAFGILDTRTCFRVLIEALDRYTQQYPHDKIWLCGHSLGATMATAAGQAMATREIYLTTFLFNPVTDLDPTTKNLFVEDLRNAMFGMTGATLFLGAAGFVLAGAALAFFHSVKAVVEHIEREMGDEELYQKMTSWVPVIFLNREDFFCKDYIEYFVKRKMKSRPYLPKRIASAVLVLNLDEGASTFPKSHEIRQWWTDNLHVQAIVCQLGYEPRILDHTRY